MGMGAVTSELGTGISSSLACGHKGVLEVTVTRHW